jgi:stage V sporulation protein B
VSAEPGNRRGAIAIGAAKAWFLVVGLAQNILLPVVIGQGGFGAYKRALAFVNVVNNVIVVASIQAVSRAVASAPGTERRATMLRATGMQAAIGLGLGVAFYLAVPLMVAHQHAPHLAAPLRTLAGILIAYGIYAPVVGALNGVRAFGSQAALDATYSTLRTGLSVAIGWFFVDRLMGDGALGASVGFLVAAIAIVPVAWILARVVRDDGTAEGSGFVPRAHVTFLVGLLAMQAFQALLLQVDLLMIGRAATLRALADGVPEIDARRLADRVAGLYAQAQSFGLVPYQLLIAAGFVLFPTVAAARARGDHDAIAREVTRGGAATLVVAGALVAALGGAPLAVLRFAFGSGGPDALPVAMAAPILRVLAIAHGATAIATLGTTLVAASGRGRLAAGLSAIVAASAIVGVALATNLATSVTMLGVFTATGLCAGIILGAVVVAIVVGRVVGPYLRLVSLLRVAAGIAIALAVGSYVPVANARVLAPLSALVPLVVYLAVVGLLGESLRGLLGPSRDARTT